MSDLPYIGIDEEVIDSLMKQFLSGKKSDPDILKFYMEKDGVDYFCTTIGSALGVIFKNKYDARDGTKKFIQPLPKNKREVVDEIEGYPDVETVFDINFSDHHKIPSLDIEKMIRIHEAISKTKDYGGIYHSARMVIEPHEISISNYDNQIEIAYRETSTEELHRLEDFNYNFDWMVAIWKTFKKLKVEDVHLYYTTRNDPIYLVAEDVDYKYIFAIKRILVR